MSAADTVKLLNQTRILRLLYSEESASRATLAKRLGLARSALTTHVARLLEAGLVIETEEKDNQERTGRPGVVLRLNRGENFFFGAEIGGQFLRVIALDFSAQVIAKRLEPFPFGATPEHVISLLKKVVAEIIFEGRLNAERARGIGIAVSGLVTRTGRILYSPALGWKNTPILELIENEMGRFPVSAVLNDANAAAFGEAYVERRLTRAEMCYLLVDEGVGLGVLSEGKLFTGADGLSGEIGSISLHLRNRSSDSLACSFESAVGNQGLSHLFREHGLSCTSPEEVRELLERHEREATAAIDIWLDWLIEGLAAVTVLYDPREIRLGGRGISPAKMVFEDLTRRFRLHLEEIRSSYPPPELVFGLLDDAAPAIGSACFLHEKLFSVSAVLPDDIGRDRINDVVFSTPAKQLHKSSQKNTRSLSKQKRPTTLLHL